MRKSFHWSRADENCRWRGSALQSSCQIVSRLVLLACSFALQAQDVPRNDTGVPLPALPEAKSPFTLLATNDPVTGKSAFSFDGKELPPVIRSSPGSQIKLEYLNRMSTNSKEVCVD
jgi:hypothetical protein